MEEELVDKDFLLEDPRVEELLVTDDDERDELFPAASCVEECKDQDEGEEETEE